MQVNKFGEYSWQHINDDFSCMTICGRQLENESPCVSSPAEWSWSLLTSKLQGSIFPVCQNGCGLKEKWRYCMVTVTLGTLFQQLVANDSQSFKSCAVQPALMKQSQLAKLRAADSQPSPTKWWAVIYLTCVKTPRRISKSSSFRLSLALHRQFFSFLHAHPPKSVNHRDHPWLIHNVTKSLKERWCITHYKGTIQASSSDVSTCPQGTEPTPVVHKS